MGLDQYLTARKYFGGWKHSKQEERDAYAAILRASGLDPDKATAEGSPHAHVEVCAVYWRKANQVHAWFVANVQDGKDDCGTYDVERSQLEELANLCEEVLAESELVPGTITNGYESTESGPMKPCLEEGKLIADPSAAKAKLPTASGFFFGSTDYDGWYYDDLKRTSRDIRAALATFDTEGWDGWQFQYHSSW